MTSRHYPDHTPGLRTTISSLSTAQINSLPHPLPSHPIDQADFRAFIVHPRKQTGSIPDQHYLLQLQTHTYFPTRPFQKTPISPSRKTTKDHSELVSPKEKVLRGNSNYVTICEL
ncbi:hypothetical protein D9613_010260 [Agrocybe pediades]|uniref:Uncharacterized protein n=1 Tax=Agrocybe pediades TaxID=84607 RepID=A0A8H4QF37_9AGAR|nr:hypothetical protein D9613_010260 [Agrocybe pediades]